jgi:PAS domain-containing protein
MSRFTGAKPSASTAAGYWPDSGANDVLAPATPPSSVALSDPAQPRRGSEGQADREALEHIARAVQGRVLRGPGSLSPAGALGLETLALSRASIEALLEAMPAAIGILVNGDLVHANAAFAYAFGYRAYGELRAAGGLETVIPGGRSLLRGAPDAVRERTVAVDALTRGRRRLKVRFEVSPLGQEFELLRLVDPGGDTLDADAPSLAAAEPVPDAGEAGAVSTSSPRSATRCARP